MAFPLRSLSLASPLTPAIGLVLDRLVGEPASSIHPVVWLGHGLQRLESWTYRDSKAAGSIHLGLALGTGVLLGHMAGRTLGRRAATILSVGLASSGRMLARSANTIGDQLSKGDLAAARHSLPTLVGRDPSNLDPSEVSRAVIESVAENTVDAVTASVFFSAFGRPGPVICHRISNTLDAMVGHRSSRYEQFGWASARLDDVLAAIPARLTVLAIMAARPGQAQSVLTTIRRDAWKHPSPNGGLVEAGFAAALDLRLGGSNSYDGIVEDRGTLGLGADPLPSDIDRAVRLADQVTILFGLAPVVVTLGFRLFKSCILTHSHLCSCR